MKPRLAIITSHPIQYNAPLFRLLAVNGNFNVKVFYTLGKDSSAYTDPGFNKAIKWDIPLLDGYDYSFVQNTSANPSTSKFRGIVNPTLIQEIESFGASHVLIYGWSFQSHLASVRYFHKRAKIIFRGDSTLLDEKLGIKTILRRLFLKWIYRHIDLALYVGTNNKGYFFKHGVPESKLLFAPHAIDNVRFSLHEHELKAKELKNKLGISFDKKVFIFTGKFELKKNPKLLIRAFNLLKSTDAVLLMVGDGKLENELKQLAKSNSNIKFLPFQNQSIMPIIYRLADVLVLPSQGPGETWGLSINEAMACGLAIIASDKVGGAIDLINERKNGFIFKSNNLEDLITHLTFCTNLSTSELKVMGTYSREIIQSWSFETIYNVIETKVMSTGN